MFTYMLLLVPHKKRRWIIASGISTLLVIAILLAWQSQSASLLSAGNLARHGRMANIPLNILWAWERPEKFDFINPRETGVAYLARTIYLRDERVVVRPRLQPLDVPAGTTLIAVARIESDRRQVPALTATQTAETAIAIAELGRAPGVAAIQIDFDATISERDFYRALLTDLRQRLPTRMPLVITALASWCTHDDWLTGLPIDEAVPMLFRMGVDRQQINSYLKAGAEFTPQVCRTSLGVSTDETASAPSSTSSRLYIFHPRSWTKEAAHATFERYRNETQSP